jgi:hypothetical protein
VPDNTPANASTSSCASTPRDDRPDRPRIRSTALASDDQLVTAAANLLARKRKLLRKLENTFSDAERDEIERQIAQTDTALDLLEALAARTDHKNL